MPSLAPPPSTSQDINSRQFRDWFYSIYALLGQPGQTLGTMAYQDANSVAITGGAIGGVGISGSTINSTPIGQTTAAPGKFTTLQATGTTVLDTLTGYLKGTSGTVSATSTIPSGDISGLGTMATQNANNVAITGGSINGTTIGATTPSRVNTNAFKTTGLTGYLYGNDNTGDVTASTTIPMANVLTGYGSFQNTANQTFATANTATKIVLNTTDFIRGMTRSSSTITDITAGIYNVQFSLQMANSDTQIQEIEIWLRKNGSDIAGTASKYSIPAKHGSIDGYSVPVANFFIDFTTSDTLELWGAVTSTNLYIEAYAAQTSPFARPSVPSSVLTLSPIS